MCLYMPTISGTSPEWRLRNLDPVAEDLYAASMTTGRLPSRIPRVHLHQPHTHRYKRSRPEGSVKLALPGMVAITTSSLGGGRSQTAIRTDSTAHGSPWQLFERNQLSAYFESLSEFSAHHSSPLLGTVVHLQRPSDGLSQSLTHQNLFEPHLLERIARCLCSPTSTHHERHLLHRCCVATGVIP